MYGKRLIATARDDHSLPYLKLAFNTELYTIHSLSFVLFVGNWYRTEGHLFNWEATYTTIILTFRPFFSERWGEFVSLKWGYPRFRGVPKKTFCCITVKPIFLFELKHSGLSSTPGGHSKEDWVEVWCRGLQSLTLFIHATLGLRQETLFYDPDSFRFTYRN